jgi:hypothetical protein
LIKLISVAAFAVTALVALPASASDLHVAKSTASVVRIALANKSPTQISQEINAAARTVCTGLNASETCFADAVSDANRQVQDITGRSHQPAAKIEVARNDPSTVRISVKGKSFAQLNQEIDAAANTVCKGAMGADFHDCVTAASQDAKRRLAEANKVGALAMN